jgi:hypothetical protein
MGHAISWVEARLKKHTPIMAAAIALWPPWCSPPQHRRIQQLANMLRDKSMLLKLENIIVFTIYELF